MADGFEVNKHDIDLATTGLAVQFASHDMDMARPNVKALFDHLVRVQSHNTCVQRELSKSVHLPTK